MSLRVSSVKVSVNINGDDYEMEMNNLWVSEDAQQQIKEAADELVNALLLQQELLGNIPRTDRSKYKLDDDGEVAERPDSDFKS